MQIWPKVFMARTMDAKKPQSKQENGDNADTSSPLNGDLGAVWPSPKPPAAMLKLSALLQRVSLPLWATRRHLHHAVVIGPATGTTRSGNWPLSI